MAAFIQAVAQYGLRLAWLPRVRLGEMAIRLADIAGMRQGEVTREPCALPAVMRHDHRRDAAVAPMEIDPFMPAMRTAQAPMVDRPAARAT